MGLSIIQNLGGKMKAFGYDKVNMEAKSPVELKEFMLVLTKGEIDKVIAFLEHTQKKFVPGASIMPHAHQHFRDWSVDWSPEEADLIIYYEGQ
jgi:hypothetical protein